MLSVKGVWFRYDDEWVLRDISLSAGKGDFIAIIGRNGSGKSTLLRLILGILKPVKGSVTIAGKDTRRTKVSEIARIVGYMHQNPNEQLFETTVRREIAFSLIAQGWERDRAMEEADRIIEELGIRSIAHMNPRFLSRGEKQFVVLASLLAAKPRVLLLDEPTTGLDYRNTLRLLGLLEEYRRNGGTVVLVTHDVKNVAKVADKVYVLHKGEVVLEGNPLEVFSYKAVAKYGVVRPQILELTLRLADIGLDPALTVEEAVRGFLKRWIS